MKKRILSFLLVLCSLLTLVVVPVSGTKVVEETATQTTPLIGACPCGCGETLDQVDWRVYDPNSGGLLPGHFYLAEDYIQKDQFTVATDAKIVLDLRGHTLTTNLLPPRFLLWQHPSGQPYASSTATTHHQHSQQRPQVQHRNP